MDAQEGENRTLDEGTGIDGGVSVTALLSYCVMRAVASCCVECGAWSASTTMVLKKRVSMVILLACFRRPGIPMLQHTPPLRSRAVAYQYHLPYGRTRRRGCRVEGSRREYFLLRRAIFVASRFSRPPPGAPRAFGRLCLPTGTSEAPPPQPPQLHASAAGAVGGSSLMVLVPMCADEVYGRHTFMWRASLGTGTDEDL